MASCRFAVQKWNLGRCAEVLLFALAVLPFVAAVGYGLIDLDDYNYLIEHGGKSIFDVSESIWMPLTWLSYRLDDFLWGEAWGGYHATSLFVHGCNACLVWILLRRISGELGGAARALPFLAAVFWAVHPLRCESVVLLSSRKDVLSLFFELLALVCWMRDGRCSRVGANLFFVIGSLCKPSVMTFPVLCAILDFFVRRRIRVRDYVFPSVYMVFLGVFATWQQTVGGATGELAGKPLWGKCAGAAAAYGMYLWNTVWPKDLAVQCIDRWPDLPRFLWPGLCICAVVAAYFLMRGRRYWRTDGIPAVVQSGRGFPEEVLNRLPADGALAGLLWFSASVFPMLGFKGFGFHAFADRFTYIPAIGLSLAVLASGIRRGRWYAAMLGAVVLAMGLATVRQTSFWKDDFTLFSHTLEVDGDGNTLAHFNLAKWYFEFPHDLEKCVREFEAIERQDLKYAAKAFEIYVFALCELGRTDEIAEKLRMFETTARRLVGEEDWQRAWRGEIGGLPFLYVDVYRLSKAVWWTTDPTCLGQVEEYVAETQTDALKRDSIWLYLLWRLEIARHGAGSPEARRARERIVRDGEGASYIQFRYLKGGAQ